MSVVQNNTISTNSITEATSANGVSIDGLKIKDYSLMYGSNTGLTVSSDGYVTKPNIPIFSAYMSSNMTNIASGDWRPIQFDSLDYACSHYDTSNYTFTTPIAGKYQFNICIRIDGIDTGITYVQLNTNIGGGLFYGPIIDPNFSANPAYWYMAHSQVWNIGASTAVRVEIYTGGTPDVADVISSNVQTRWSGFLVG